MTLDLIIPVLNEELTLDQKIRQVVRFIESNLPETIQTWIVIADNGSRDATPTLAKKLVFDFPLQIRYIQLEKRGVGLALKTAWRASSADLVGYMDLDLATDLEALPKAVNALASGSDVVYGTRLHSDSEVIGRSLMREFVSRCFNFILKKYLNVQFSDGMCGFKFLKRQHFSEIQNYGAVSDGWFFCTELLAAAEKLNLKLYELPVKWIDDPNSKVKIVSLSFEYLVAMRKLKQQIRRSLQKLGRS